MERNNTVHGPDDVRWRQGENTTEVGNDVGRKNNDDCEIGKEHGKEDDVMAQFNGGLGIERFDELMRNKGDRAASWCRTEEVQYDQGVVEEVEDLRGCSTKKMNRRLESG